MERKWIISFYAALSIAIVCAIIIRIDWDYEFLDTNYGLVVTFIFVISFIVAILISKIKYKKERYKPPNQ